MTSEEQIDLFKECASLLRKLSCLRTLYIDKEFLPSSDYRIHIKTDWAPSDLGVFRLPFPDSIISYHTFDNSITVYRQKNDRYYVDVGDRFHAFEVTAEKLAESFLSHHPKLRKSALMILTEGSNV